MNAKISKPLHTKVNDYCGRVFPFIAISLLVTGFFFWGCAGQVGTKGAMIKKTENTDETVYQVTEQEALKLSQWALEQALPDQTIHQLKKPRVGFFIHENEQKGHYKYARFMDATFIYEVDLFRMTGITPQGQNIVGYTYAIKGNGDLKAGPGKLARLEQQLAVGFEKTGRAVTVSSLQPEPPQAPVISSDAPPASDTISTEGTIEKPVIREAPAAVVPMVEVKEKPIVEKEGDVFMKLKKLKGLLDQGVITEEEFQTKKKELLDRI